MASLNSLQHTPTYTMEKWISFMFNDLSQCYRLPALEVILELHALCIQFLYRQCGNELKKICLGLWAFGPAAQQFLFANLFLHYIWAGNLDLLGQPTSSFFFFWVTLHLPFLQSYQTLLFQNFDNILVRNVPRVNITLFYNS